MRYRHTDHCTNLQRTGNTDHLHPTKGDRMTARPAYTVESYVDDLLLLIRYRGMSVGQAAAHEGMSRATAYRLLKEHKAREAAGRQ